MSQTAGSNAESDLEASPAESDPYAGWIDRIAAGDSQAFEMLFRALYERLCVFAESYVGSSDAAEEVVDDVFLNVWRGRERLRIRTSVLSYLFVAVRNKALTRIRRTQVERRYAERAQAEGLTVVVNGAGELEEWVATSDLVILVQEAVSQLPTRAQQTYVLYYQQHLSYAEIAQIMGVTVKTVENQLSRALKLLWLRLEGRIT